MGYQTRIVKTANLKIMKNTLIFFVFFFFVAFFTACEENGIIDRSVDVDGGARISYVNLSSGSPEVNLYFNDVRTTSVRSQTENILRGIPYRSSFPGVVTASPTSTTMPAPSNVGIEYFLQDPGTYTITVKDTAYRAGFTTYASSQQTFENNKYYSVYTVNPYTSMEMIAVEDDIKVFSDTVKTRIRVVNAVSNVAGNAIDVWMVHQPQTGVYPIPPYKLADNLSYKDVTSFVDTIDAGTYKWMVTIAGAVPTTNSAPVNPTGSPYTLTFAGADLIYSSAATNATVGSQYSMLVFGEKGSTGVKAPFSGLFRNRYK